MLLGKCGANEKLVYPEAECVKRGQMDTLLPFACIRKKKGHRFKYLAGVARPLKEVQRKAVSSEHLEAMLVSFFKLGQACDANGLLLQRVSFDAEHIFYDPVRYSLRFAYMPVSGGMGNATDPLDALEAVLARSKIADPQAAATAEVVLDHVRRASLFSWPVYGAFLEELGKSGPVEADPPEGLKMSRRAPDADSRLMYGYDFMDV